MEYTEGPWRVSEWSEQDDESHHYEIISGTMWVCKISPYFTGEYENAKLISKAPEMYEALKKVYSRYGDPKVQDMVESLLKELES